MIVHDATPSIDSALPATIGFRTRDFAGLPLTTMDRPSSAVWEWLLAAPVWPRIRPESTADLVFAGHATGVTGGAEPLAVGLPVVVCFEVLEWNPARRSQDHVRTTVAVNEDGTRGAVVRTERIAGSDEAADHAAESLAWRAGGGIPDVD